MSMTVFNIYSWCTQTSSPRSMSFCLLAPALILDANPCHLFSWWDIQQVSLIINFTPPSSATSLRPKSTVKVTNDEDDDLWGSIAAPAPKTTTRPLNVKSATALDDDDPWAAIAAPPPTTRAKPLVAGRGRGKPAASKLGAQRINRTSSSGM